MTKTEKTHFEMTLHNFSVELNNLCQLDCSFDEVETLTLEAYHIQLSELINKQKSALRSERKLKQALLS